MKTVNDLIIELKSLKPSLKELPVVISAKNGLLFEPMAKVLIQNGESVLDTPKQIIITYF